MLLQKRQQNRPALKNSDTVGRVQVLAVPHASWRPQGSPLRLDKFPGGIFGRSGGACPRQVL